jgi:hypothetical protein
MSKEVEFTYFLNGKEVEKENVDWDKETTVKVVDNDVFITQKEKE